jgi:hypothetical protein
LDPLSSFAPLLRVRPVLDDLCRFGGVWDSPHEAEGPGCAYFHIVTRGECLIERIGQGPLQLKAGDVLLLPRGDPHVVRARRGSSGTHAGVTSEYRNAIRSKTSIGIPPDTEVICGRLYFDTAPESLLIAALPDVIVLRPTDWPDAERMGFMLESVRDELDSDRAGAAAIATLFPYSRKASHQGRSAQQKFCLDIRTRVNACSESIPSWPRAHLRSTMRASCSTSSVWAIPQHGISRQPTGLFFLARSAKRLSHAIGRELGARSWAADSKTEAALW